MPPRQAADALEIAAQALACRDLSAAALEGRLRRKGVEEGEIETAIGRLKAAGYLDDGRVARERARQFAERGYGDAAIDERLEHEGVGPEERAAALAKLEPEPARAARLAAGQPARGFGAALARRGFSEESIEAAVTRLDGHAGAELR